MIPEMAKQKVEALTREEQITLVYEMAKEISALKAEIARHKQPPPTSKNSSQPPSRDFKASNGKKRKRSRKKGAQPGHEKQARPLVDNPDKVIEAYAEQCENCQVNLTVSITSFSLAAVTT